MGLTDHSQIERCVDDSWGIHEPARSTAFPHSPVDTVHRRTGSSGLHGRPPRVRLTPYSAPRCLRHSSPYRPGIAVFRHCYLHRDPTRPLPTPIVSTGRHQIRSHPVGPSQTKYLRFKRRLSRPGCRPTVTGGTGAHSGEGRCCSRGSSIQGGSVCGKHRL